MASLSHWALIEMVHGLHRKVDTLWVGFRYLLLQSEADEGASTKWCKTWNQTRVTWSTQTQLQWFHWAVVHNCLSSHHDSKSQYSSWLFTPSASGLPQTETDIQPPRNGVQRPPAIRLRLDAVCIWFGCGPRIWGPLLIQTESFDARSRITSEPINGAEPVFLKMASNFCL